MDEHANRIVDLYRRHADTWHQQRTPWLARHKWLDRLLDITPTQPRVLDLGCGTGAPIARYLQERGARLTGVDTAPSLLERARDMLPDGIWINADMRRLSLGIRFDAILAWNSFFHLTPAAQRNMFAVFAQHAAPHAVLLFTAGPKAGVAMGTFQGEPLYHSSLAPEEYRALLNAHGFDVIGYVPEDPECGAHTVWLAQARSPSPSAG